VADEPINSLPPQDEAGFPYDTTWLSVLQFFVKDYKEAEFERYMEEMFELAQKQPGYRWAHFGRSMIDGRWFVISEWDSYQTMKDWEHEERHEAVGEEVKPLYDPGRDMENRKFIPWYKPGAERKTWTP
jgi:heme-degrading monooxygenase HmoA